MSAEQSFLEMLKSINSVVTTAPPERDRADLTRVPVTLRNLFTNFDTHPAILDLSLLKLFGPSWFGWEAQTIWMEIQKELDSTVSEWNRAKIHVVKTIHVSSLPWESWNVFEKVLQGLNSSVPRPDLMQIPSLPQLFAGVDILNQLREESFDDEVKSYMAAVVLHDDVFFVPPPLDFIQAEVSQPYYRCKDCESEFGALHHDGVCDVCTEKFTPENGLSMRPNSEALADGKGKDLEIHMHYDPSVVQARWNEVAGLASEKIHLVDSPVDTQVGKLIGARDYMNVRRQQLKEQLISLQSWLRAS